MKNCFWRFTAIGWIAVALTVTFDATVSSLAAQDNPDEKELAVTRAAILKRLRRECEDEPLRGVLIKSAKDGKLKAKGGKRTLVLEGFLDAETQRKPLAQKAAALLALAEWKDRYPGGVVLNAMTISAVRSGRLERLKIDFALGTHAKELKRLLSQTRLDDVYYHHPTSEPDDRELIVQGVCIFDKEKAGREEEDARKDLKVAITQFLIEECAPREMKGTPFKVNVAQILFADPLPAFQKRFTDHLLISDILFRDATYAKDGTLLLSGWVGGPDVERKRKLFEEQFSNHPFVKGSKPQFSFKGMDSTFGGRESRKWLLDIKKWNAELAHANETDLNTAHLLRVYFDLVNGAPQLRFDAVTFQDAEKKGAVRKALVDQLLKELENAWPETARGFGATVVGDVTSRLELRDKIQRAVIHDLGMKHALITSVLYDSEGALFVEGTVGRDEDKEAIAKFLKNSAWTRWSNGPPRLDGVRVENWSTKLKLVQEALVSDTNDKFKKARLDEVYLAFTGKDQDLLQLRFTGITFDEQDKKELIDFLIKECKRWPALARLIDDRVEPEFKPLAAQDLEMHDRIEANELLDGVFLEKTPYFNGDGKLVLVGKWRGPKQHQKELQKLIDTRFQAKMLQPNTRGIVFDQLVVVPTDQILEDLKTWVAKAKKEDIRPNRIYFDRQGILHLSLGKTRGSKESEEKVRAELNRLIKLLDGKNRELKLGDCANEKPDDACAVASEELQDDARPLLAKYLREKVVTPEDARWDGVLIERGYYGVDAKYHIDGLVDNPGQIKLLEENLGKLANTFEWGESLKKKWTINLRPMPIGKMLQALRGLMPETAELDRIRLNGRAYHGPDKKLILTGFTTGADEKAAAAVFAEYLLAHPDWRERVAASLFDPEVDAKEREARSPGMKLDLTPVAVNRRAAELAGNRAYLALVNQLPDYVNDPGPATPVYRWAYWGCVPIFMVDVRDTKKASPPDRTKLPSAAVLAKNLDYLDVALFHVPEESTSWYLRAAYHLAAGDEASALRDLRRMNEIEARDARAQRERLAALEHFQGQLRQRTTAFAERALLQAAAGHRVPSLAEIVRLSAK